MIIKRINPVSCAKIMALLYGIIGLFIGSITALIVLIGRTAANGTWAQGPMTALGVGSILVFPLLYGALGFIGTWIAASIYNVLAGVVGGIQVETAPLPGPQWNALGETRVPSL